MRKALLYLLLFSYTTIICKPLLPAFSDGLAHIFWYSQHMATVHYEHGKYHVHTENALEAKRDYPVKESSGIKTAPDLSEHLLTAQMPPFNSPVLTAAYTASPVPALAHIFPGNDVPPPKA